MTAYVVTTVKLQEQFQILAVHDQKLSELYTPPVTCIVIGQ